MLKVVLKFVLPKTIFSQLFYTLSPGKSHFTMKKFFQNPLYSFLFFFILISLPLVLMPLNLFEGEIVYQEGISKIVEPRPLSLHFILGLEYFNKPLPPYVQDYYLTAKGIALALIFTIGFPGIMAYRAYLQKKQK
jgi:hypothetical protein